MATSSQTELRLVNVARASLDELLLDYEDFLRQRQLQLWHKDSVLAKQVRELGWQQSNNPTDSYAVWLTHADPAIVANTIICLPCHFELL